MLPRKNYLIERVPKMRGFRIYVYPNSTVVVRCSLKCSLAEIDKFVRQNSDWIRASLTRSEKVKEGAIPASYQDGETLLLLGEKYRVTEHDHNSKKAELKPGRIILISKKLSYLERKKEIQRLFKKTAASVISKRVEFWAEETGLVPKDLKFRNNKTLWGTCMPGGHIILNWKLICAPIGVIDYVVIHELCHLKVRNHSQRFWSLVESYCANHRQMRLWLKQNHYAFDFLNDVSEIHSSKIQPDARRHQASAII